jgi:tetratricopeptide (TPR) repeat protein
LWNQERATEPVRTGRSRRVPRRHWIAALSLWPGLPQIWSGQEVLGLILAALFAATLNLAIVAQFIWTEAFAPGWAGFFGALAACSWLASLGYTLSWVWLCHPSGHRAEIDRLFREAAEFYLQGHYHEARGRFERILAMDDNDADALMQLGTLFIRTEQPSLARRSFRQCLELEGGAKWRWEIQQVLARLGDGPPSRT